MRKKDAQIGKKVGMLTILKVYSTSKPGKRLYAECVCDCGNVKNIKISNLGNKAVVSCGCFKRRIMGKTIEPGESSFIKKFNYYKRGAIRRNLNFEISLDFFKKISCMDCFYCGEPPKPFNRFLESKYDTRRTNPRTILRAWIKVNGIDRKNNSLGYIESNCVAACKKCNLMKHVNSFDDFIEHAKKITNHWENK